jgi:uncharacterized protein (TIGR02145 family)
MRRFGKYLLALALIGLTMSACKDKEETPEVPVYGLNVLRGNNQQGTVTLWLNNGIEFQVTDQKGNPVKGEAIYFEKSDSITLSADSLVTDSLGMAVLEWKMGSSSGDYTFNAFLMEEGIENPDTRIEVVATANTYGFFTDERDGRQYKFVKVGDQFWMAENLDYGERISGHKKPTPDDGITQKYYYLDDLDKGATYGGLYTWEEAMNGSPSDEKPVSTTQGICPDGWHLPSYGEWFEIMQLAGNDPRKLKSQEGWNIEYDTNYVFDTINLVFTDEIDTIVEFNFNGTDEFGFRALGAGYRGLGLNEENQSYYWTEGVYSYYLTTREYSWDKTFYYAIGIYGPPPNIFDAGPVSKDNGFCVRCIMDKE